MPPSTAAKMAAATQLLPTVNTYNESEARCAVKAHFVEDQGLRLASEL